MNLQELRNTIRTDYQRLMPVRGGVLQRLMLSPEFSIIFYFRVLTWMRNVRMLRPLYVLLYLLYRRRCARRGLYLRIGTRIGQGFHIAHLTNIVINQGALIGKNCMLFQGVTLGGMRLFDGRVVAPVVGDNVTIFAGAKIVGGVKVGNNVVIGANAVVTHDVPDNAVVAGVPAKIISMKGKQYAELYTTGM